MSVTKLTDCKYKCKVHGVINEAIKFDFKELRQKDSDLLSGVYCPACILEQMRFAWGLMKLKEVEEEK